MTALLALHGVHFDPMGESSLCFSSGYSVSDPFTSLYTTRSEASVTLDDGGSGERVGGILRSAGTGDESRDISLMVIGWNTITSPCSSPRIWIRPRRAC